MSSKSGSGERARPTSAIPPVDERVLVGEVLRPHGLRGEVKLEVHSDVEDRFAVGGQLLLNPREGRPTWVRIASFRRARGAGLIRFDGIEDRDAAESLRGAQLEIDQQQVPQAPEGCYYHFDLVGCRCFDAHAGELGVVEQVLEDGGGTLLALRREKRTLLVPFVDAFLERVDTESGRIDLVLPEGLIEACASKS